MLRMDLEAQSRHVAASVPMLPPFSVYLRDVFHLGKRSFRPALPALALLYFYGVGTGIFFAVNPDSEISQARSVGAYLPALASLVAFLPMLMLIYTPFLPLQDSLLRGREIPFRAAVRRVLELAWYFIVSTAIQLLICLAPVVPIAAVAWLLVPGAGNAAPAGAHAAGTAILAIALSMGWVIIAATFLIFATPAVVLESRGPIRSIGVSVRLVRGHFWGILGRFLGFFVVLVFAGVIAGAPVSFLTAAARAAGGTGSTPLVILETIWSSAVSALLFPFGVAALLLLFRALYPARTAAAAGPAPGVEDLNPAANPLLFE